MPDLPIPPALAVVVLGLLASVGWGVADFGGGLTSRRAPVLGVLGGSQLASLFVGVPILLFVTNEPAMSQANLLIAIFGGVLGASGLALLYRGLAIGRMGVVAPVAAVLTATLPVVYGFITEGAPPPIALVGIGLAVLSVVLVSRSSDRDDDRPSGIRYGLAAGTIFGLFTTTASFLDDDLLMGPVVVIRITSVLLIAAFVLLRGQRWRVPTRIWPALLFVGVVDMLATATYLASIAIGPLSIAAILASLYPVVTVILAALVLREKVTLIHAAGIAAAGLAVVLIAGASA